MPADGEAGGLDLGLGAVLTMPRRVLSSFTLVALAAVLSFALTGCTAIGFGIGALEDAPRGKGDATRLATVYPGTNITMWLEDGQRLDGLYLGSQDSITETARPERDSLRSVVVLETRHGVRQVPIQDVNRVSVPVARGKVIGTVSGLMVDATVAYVLFWKLSHLD